MKAFAVPRQVFNVDALTLKRRQQFVVRVPHLSERDPEENGTSRPRTVVAAGSIVQTPQGPMPDAASFAAVVSTSRTTEQV
jgi:hypothetical protein